LKRALITGVNGFAGQYLAENLLDNGYEVWGAGRSGNTASKDGINKIQLAYSDIEDITRLLETIKPNVIFHLSGQSSVKKSWGDLKGTFDSNLFDTINLLESVKNSSLRQDITLITIGSSEEYGLGVVSPITEEMMPAPSNPYGLSKYTLGNLSLMYSNTFGMSIIHTRSFNHIGPRQVEGFVTADFAKQIANITNGKAERVIHVGDLSSKRDFTDVRDIVEAYRLLYEKGERGQIYNVCSGTCISIEDILHMLSSFSKYPVKILIDPNKFRPNNIPEYFGSNNKIVDATGWKPKITIEQSLHDIYMYWLNK
jgi:GDP-4-dehydro-6-deoxy-D-mannose reductase